MKLAVFCAFLSALIAICSTDLTGLHYLHTINCSSSEVYFPKGPYLFSHHWPFPWISVKYHRQSNDGLCQRDGSLTFSLNDDKFCIGTYHQGKGKLFCQIGSNESCWIGMQTSDGSPLTCDILV